MRTPSTMLLVCLLAPLAACGPPHADAGGDSSNPNGGSETGQDTTSTGTSATTPADTETDTADDQMSTRWPSFVPDEDEGLIGVEGCEPFLQDCADGEKCVPWGPGDVWQDSKCVPVTGSQPAGQPCVYGGVEEATDDCDADSFCWDTHEVDGELLGVCHAFCTGALDDPQCPEGSFCLHDLINLCIPTCDPILQDCDGELACHWFNIEFICVQPTLDVPIGEVCGGPYECTGGSACLAADMLPACAGAACCAPYCDVELGDALCDALPGSVCVPFFEDGLAPPQYMHVGVCIAP